MELYVHVNHCNKQSGQKCGRCVLLGNAQWVVLCVAREQYNLIREFKTSGNQYKYQLSSVPDGSSCYIPCNKNIEYESFSSHTPVTRSANQYPIKDRMFVTAQYTIFFILVCILRSGWSVNILERKSYCQQTGINGVVPVCVLVW